MRVGQLLLRSSSCKADFDVWEFSFKSNKSVHSFHNFFKIFSSYPQTFIPLSSLNSGSPTGPINQKWVVWILGYWQKPLLPHPS